MKVLFILINLFFITVMAYVCVGFFYNSLVPAVPVLPDHMQTSAAENNNNSRPRIPSNMDKNQYDSVVTRNIFKAELEESQQAPVVEEKSPEKLEPTSLKLILWGTVTGDTDDTETVWAVIEDQKLRQQSLYTVGDVIQGASIKKIFRHEIVLEYQGKDQILAMETDKKSPQVANPALTKAALTAGRQMTGSMSASPPSSDAGQLMRHIRFRPYFSQGVPDGLMVYGIRPNSIFTRMGLRNGDIVKNINGMPIVSPDDGMGMFQEIEAADAIDMTVMRRGKITELSFQGMETAGADEEEYSDEETSDDQTGEMTDEQNTSEKDEAPAE